MLDTEVHIVAGPSAAACLQDGLALSPDRVLVHHDLLSCGPLSTLDSLENWRDVRESYLRSLDIEGPSLSFAEQDGTEKDVASGFPPLPTRFGGPVARS